MTCANVNIVAVIVTPDGLAYEGVNLCKFPSKVCPRKLGEDYKKCELICGQISHAEVAAIKKAKTEIKNLRGSYCYLFGHTNACETCRKILEEEGITLVCMTPEVKLPPWKVPLGKH